TINATAVSTFTLIQSASGTAMIAGNEYIGTTTTGDFYNQSAGTNNITNALIIGSLSTSSNNTYTLSGTGALSSLIEDVGYAGSGIITQSAGTNTVSGLSLGTQSTGNGQYTLNAVNTGTGTLTAANESIGDSGTGAFVQNAGTNSVSTELLVANNGNGTYTLNGGTLTFAATAIAETIGNNAGSTGTFTQTGGAQTLGTNVELNVGLGGIGYYNMNGGTLSSNGAVIVGYSNTGTFTQTAGTVALSNTNLCLAESPGATGNYNLQGGTLTITYSDEVVGEYGTGTFTQSGASSNLINSLSDLYVGANTNALGVYNLQNGSLDLSAGSEYIGGNPGVITVGPVSAGAAGDFTQFGGSNAVSNSSSSLYLGVNAGDVGIYNLQGGSLSVGADEFIGQYGTGTLTQSGTSTNTVTGDIEIGYGQTVIGPSGTYNLQGGQLMVSGYVYVGDGSNGTFDQTGGTLTAGGLNLGHEANAAYTFSAGVINSTAREVIGQDVTTTTFVQTGGVNNANGGIEIAEEANGLATSTYTLTAPGIINAAGETVGADGAGIFIQNSGANNVTGDFELGAPFLVPGSHDTYTMDAGTLTVDFQELIGPGTYGAFTQEGGVNTANAEGLDIGGSDYAASYTLEGGTLAATIVNVGYNGSFNVSAGIVNCSAGTLTGLANLNQGPGIPPLPGGMVNFSGGSMTFAALDFDGQPADFVWTGGTLNLTQALTFDPDAGPTTTSAAFGNSLTLNAGMALNIPGNETIGGNGYFTLTLNAGSSDVATGNLTVAPTGTLVQDLGPLAQSLNNQGTFIYEGGAFPGQLTNSGNAAFELSFTAPGGMVNSGNVSEIPLGVTVTLNGPGLSNSGSIALDGGSVTGVIANNGLIAGYGALGGTSVINSGVISQGGGNLTLTSSTAGLSNTGTINLAAGLQFNLVGADATNDGYINLDTGNLNDDHQCGDD
ncbi:MAG: hypothetical protein ABSH22_11040, partial [Tepidisphaeraceae bacterium]